MSRNRSKYSQSVSLRKVAHQVLTSEECMTFKEALKVFRATKTTQQLVSDLGAILDSPKKLNLLREIVLLLPESQRPEFIARCRSQLKGADLLLQESFIAAEFEQRFGQKMAALTLAPMEATSSIIDGGGALGGRRMSMAVRLGAAHLPGTEAAAVEAARRLQTTGSRASDAKITLSESAPIRKLNDDKAGASVIKLRSATFQVRYRAKLPIQFDSLPEESSKAKDASPAAAGRAVSLSEDDDSCNTDEEIERDRLAAGARLRAPLSDLRDKGFWALNSPRRALEERRKLQQQRRRQRGNGGGQEATEVDDSDSPPLDLTSPENRRRPRGSRQRHHAAAPASLPVAIKASASGAAAVKTSTAGTMAAPKANVSEAQKLGHEDELESAHSPVAELRPAAPHSPSDSQIYKLLYAPSNRAAEDQMSLTSSTLEGDFLKARHLRTQTAESAIRDFDTPISLDGDAVRRLLAVQTPLVGKVATVDKAVQCNLNNEAQRSDFFCAQVPTAELQFAQQHSPPQLGFYFVPMTPYPGSHLLHHHYHQSTVATPVSGGGSSYFPWSQFWSAIPQPSPQQQQPHLRLSRPNSIHRMQQSQQQQQLAANSGRLRRVTLRKVSGDSSAASFGISVSRLGQEDAAASAGKMYLSPFVVSSVETGSPAHLQGIQPGDQLLELEGESVSNMSLHQLGLAVRSLECIRLSLLSMGASGDAWHLSAPGINGAAESISSAADASSSFD